MYRGADGSLQLAQASEGFLADGVGQGPDPYAGWLGKHQNDIQSIGAIGC